jgi:hypothetical protein
MTGHNKILVACAASILTITGGASTDAQAQLGIQDVRYECYHNGDYFGWSFFPEGCEILYHDFEWVYPDTIEKVPDWYPVVYEKQTEECIIEAVYTPIW